MAPEGYSQLYTVRLSDLTNGWFATQREAKKFEIIREAYAAGIR